MTGRRLVTPELVLPTLFWPEKDFARRVLAQALNVNRQHHAS